MTEPQHLIDSRDRRRSLTGVVDLFRTHQIALPETTIVTDDLFPARVAPITFSADIRILENSGTHRGLVFEMGSDAGQGIAVWIEDDKIGFTAGDSAASHDDAVFGTFDFGTEIPPGLKSTIVLSVRPGDGVARLWMGASNLITAAAVNAALTAWADAGDGSYASAPNGTTPLTVPATSRVVPDGFELISPLSVYYGQLPQQFITPL